MTNTSNHDDVNPMTAPMIGPATRLHRESGWIVILPVLLLTSGGCFGLGQGMSERERIPWRDEELMENLRPPRVLVESFWDATPPTEEDPERMIGAVDASADLKLEDMLSEVLRVHPTLEAAEAVWQAALEVHPQVTAFHDPNFRFLNGPTLFGNNDGAHLWRLQFSQEVPWFGKRGLQGEIADYGAENARLDIVMAQRRLQSLATDAFLEYALAEQTYALAMEDHRLAREEQLSRRVQLTSAEGEFANDERSLEELEIAELEVLELDRAREQLERGRLSARRRVNVLLRRDPRKPLPPPRMPDVPDHIPDEEVSINLALASRPELHAARTREQVAVAQSALAYKDFYPNLMFVGRFDTNADQFWWPEKLNLRPQMGIYLYPPVQQGRRWARVRQTETLLRAEQIKRRMLEDQIRDEIQEVYVDLDHMNRRRQTLNRLVAAAERRVHSRDDWVVLSGAEQTKELIAARRKLVKYQLEQLSADFQWQQQVVKLYSLMGDDLWLHGTPDSSESRSLLAQETMPRDSAREFRAEPVWQSLEPVDHTPPGPQFPELPMLLD
jgi:outer membrane protein, heavy metal efflux system